MRLNEFYEPQDDQSVSKNEGDTRKPIFTLEALNKLRKYRELKKSENIEKAKFASIMYAKPTQADTL